MALAPLLLSQGQHYHKTALTFTEHKKRNQRLSFVDVDIIHRSTKTSTSFAIIAAKTGTRIGTRARPRTKTRTANGNKNANTRTGTGTKSRTGTRSGVTHFKGEPRKKQRRSRGYKNLYTIYADLDYLCREGQLKKALTILQFMDFRGDVPVDSNIYDLLLQACIDMKALEEGKQVHAHMCLTGFDRSVYLGTKLVHLYTICGSLVDARLAFDKASERNLFLCNAMIRGYTRNGFHEEEALLLYHQMKYSGIQPDNFTFSCVLKACAGLSDLQQGKEIHTLIIKSGYESDFVVASALVGMYTRCGGSEDACEVFDKMPERDVVSWTAMISGFSHSGFWKEALGYFCQMQSEGVKPNSVTMASVLPACGNLAALQQGKEIHGYIIRHGFDSYVFVGSALVDMYSKCSSTEIACGVFDRMPERNVVSWSTMIVGYAKNGCANEALKIFRQMEQDHVKPNVVTIMNVLPACGDLAALQEGKEIHAYAIRSGFESNVYVCCALIDMYAKCGNIEVAHHVFDKMAEKDVASWNAMIAGYAINRHCGEALALFHQMQQAEFKPNRVTFVAVLFACSQAGLVAEGWQNFDCMSKNYHLTPSIEHYACMVDVLGRAGRLNEAQNVIQSMPLEPDAGVWRALLGACRIHCNIDIAEHAAERLLELEPENPGNPILLSNIYAAAGRWDDVTKVRTMMKDKGLKPRQECSWIVIKDRINTFNVGDKSHPQLEEIYSMLNSLAEQVNAMPDTNFVFRGVEDEDKENILCGHSEKLAIAFGLMNIQSGMAIRITKNLHMCRDCHSATKFISKIVGRKIIVRDASSIHHFKDGECSCGDY
eukprot:Gb_03548 [translate_table: standard]